MMTIAIMMAAPVASIRRSRAEIAFRRAVIVALP
jgi:hypothetical protein